MPDSIRRNGQCFNAEYNSAGMDGDLFLREFEAVMVDIVLGVHAEDAIIGGGEDLCALRDAFSAVVMRCGDDELLAVCERVAEVSEGAGCFVGEEILHDVVFLRGRVNIFPFVAEFRFACR